MYMYVYTHSYVMYVHVHVYYAGENTQWKSIFNALVIVLNSPFGTGY